MTRDRSKFLRSVFRKVMSRFDEIKATNCTWSCEAIYSFLTNEGLLGAQNNTNLVKASHSDFVCDVEIAAKAALTPYEHTFFKEVYLNKVKQPGLEDTNLRRRVQRKVGMEFVTRKIFPLKRYFKPVSIV